MTTPVSGLLLASGMSDAQVAVMYRLLADRLRMDYRMMEARIKQTEVESNVKFARLPRLRHQVSEGISCFAQETGQKCQDRTHWVKVDGPIALLGELAKTIEFMEDQADLLRMAAQNSVS